MTDSDLKLRSVKIGSARWARWMAEAKERRMPLTALIIERMDVSSQVSDSGTVIPLGVPASEVADDLAHALVELGEANKIIEHQTKEISELKIDRDAARMVVASLEGRVAELESYTHGLAESLDAKNTEIAELRKALAVKPLDVLLQKPALRTIDANPGTKLVSAVLPMAGTDFESRPVGSLLKGQTKGKGKP